MNTKLLIGGLVGGVILFIWSFLSWTVLPIHTSNMKYTAAQDEILSILSSKLTEDGTYYLPYVPPGTPSSDIEKIMSSYKGKPWAQLNYHAVENTNMTLNMLRGLLINIVAAIFILWLLYGQKEISFQKSIVFCIIIGLVTYLTTWYSNGIWFQTNTIPELIDAICGWGLVGLWYGWWTSRK